MKRKEFFFKILEDEFNEENEGYVCKLSQNTFVKYIGKDRITLKYASQYNFGMLSPEYYIYIDEVEKLKKKADAKGYYKWNSLQTRKGAIAYYYNLQRSIEGTFLIDSWEDLEDAACRELCFYHDFLKENYLEKYVDIEMVHRDLNLIEYDYKYNFNAFNYTYIYMAQLAICVASICGHGDLFSIKNRYIDKFQMTKEKESFIVFCKYFGI